MFIKGCEPPARGGQHYWADDRAVPSAASAASYRLLIVANNSRSMGVRAIWPTRMCRLTIRRSTIYHSTAPATLTPRSDLIRTRSGWSVPREMFMADREECTHKLYVHIDIIDNMRVDLYVRWVTLRKVYPSIRCTNINFQGHNLLRKTNYFSDVPQVSSQN